MDLNASESKNYCFYQNCHIKEKRNISFIIKIIIHVLMDSLFSIAAELPQTGKTVFHVWKESISKYIESPILCLRDDIANGLPKTALG